MSDSLLDRLRASHRAKRQKVRVLDTDVWISPLTLAESSKATAMHPDSSAMRNAAFLVMKCQDEAGKPLFTSEDKEALVDQVSGEEFGQVFRVLNGATVDAQIEK